METKERAADAPAGTTYLLEGTILEACDCNILCPCWVGEEPDGGQCSGIVAYHIERGQIRGVDVSGLTLAGVAHWDNTPMAGGGRLLMVVDEAANDDQAAALIDCFQGRLGGPLAELMGVLIGETGEWVGVERAPIQYELVEGEGHVHIGTAITATVSPFRSMYGTVTTLRDSVMSTIPGSPAWVGKASELNVDYPQYGFEYRLSGTNAIQGEFRLEG